MQRPYKMALKAHFKKVRSGDNDRTVQWDSQHTEAVQNGHCRDRCDRRSPNVHLINCPLPERQFFARRAQSCGVDNILISTGNDACALALNKFAPQPPDKPQAEGSNPGVGAQESIECGSK